ncbi:MAG: hypothetical protein Ct9H300mP1_35910 [Planctomycetaceae bacterium]|nr:MAG: hypothetical protein Ct9H300mP1_35910 [Planctomycetaceae bacterium]
MTTAGGGIFEIRLKGNTVNPLNWTIHGLEPVEPGTPYLRGHFLCLDRWGAPSDAEAKRGVPFHGEAPRVNWKLTRAPETADKCQWLSMECRLPLAGLSVVRKITLARNSGVALVSETVVNDRKLGRIYNMVQHPSIAAPFLDDSTLVDSNATRGFSQEGKVPASVGKPSRWPQMVIGKQQVDLRRFRSTQSDGTSTTCLRSCSIIGPAERMGDRCESEGETVVGIRLENASLSVAEHLATSRGWPGQIPRSRIRNDRVASALFHAGGPGKDL